MELSLEIFLAIFLPISFFIAGGLFHYLRNVNKSIDGLKGEVEGISKPITQFDNKVRELGWDKIFREITPHSLPPNKDERRKELQEKGRIYGLDDVEVNELRELLEEDARTDFAKGTIGFVAFLGIMATIGFLIRELSRRRAS